MMANPSLLDAFVRRSAWPSRDNGALHVQRALGARAMGLLCTCKRPNSTCAHLQPRTSTSAR
eukprot:6856579-Alexandrium_andersonii.AAC.1